VVSFVDFDDFHPVGIGERTYAQHTPVTWDIGRKGSGYTLELKAWRTFDISVPWFLRWLLSPHNRQVLMAARVHDELLEEGFDKAFASSEFRRALRARGVSSLFAWVLFFATLFVTAFISANRHSAL